MKNKSILILALLTLTLLTNSNAQRNDLYLTSGGEWIFSWGGTDNDAVVRFSPIANFQFNLNKDFSEKFGIFSGIAIRNVGFIYDVPDTTNIRKKFRTYNLGVPIGIKVGNMNAALLYAGYELEIPIFYKEKTFLDGAKKHKFTATFYNGVSTFHHSVFVGIQLYSGTNIKFKYYLNNFHNRDFYETSTDSYPYKDIDSHMFYISLNFDLFRNTDFYYKKVDKDVSKASLR